MDIVLPESCKRVHVTFLGKLGSASYLTYYDPIFRVVSGIHSNYGFSLSVPIQYRIDGTNRIQFINEAWFEFAAQNGAAKLNLDYIVGNLIWKFIAGNEVKHLYDLIFKAVRKTQKDAVFSFRCDSPAYRRYLRLTVSPLPDEALMLSTEQIREVSRSTVPLLDLDTARGEQYLTICSWCIKARLSSKKWMELEEAINHFDLLGRKDFPKLTHGICLECVTTIKNELKNLR